MYTFILLSTRRNSVSQYEISQRHLLLFFCPILVLLLITISGIGYGFFQKYQRSKSENALQASMEEIKQLTNVKLQVESKLAAVNEELESIRQTTERIRETLGLLGQGGGSSNMDRLPLEAEAHTQTQQEDTSSVTDTVPELEGTQAPLTPSSLKQEVQSLYNYISTQQKQIDGYPSILPVKLQKADGEKYTFWYSSGFGWRTHPLTGKREFHRGLDIKTRAGVPVVAAAAGTVLKAERSGALGKTIEIAHDTPQFKTLYAHLKDYVEGLEVGQKVKRGQIIGYVGNTGRSTGAHLHYGIYDANKNAWVNPSAYILDQQPTLSP